MRLTHQHDYKNYLANKRIALIQKAHHTIHMKVQLSNNRLVDKKILEWEDEISSDVRDSYAPGAIAREILPYNQIATSQDLRRVLKHSVVNRNPQTQMEAMKVVNSVTGDITTLEVERN